MIKNYLLRIKVAWDILTSDRHIAITRRKDQITFDRYMDCTDSIKYLTAYKNIIEGGYEAVQGTESTVNP
ncbi:hypothetical protein [Spirosoma foliorum]|uniref:Uncharacterized protein n=1 Tax=Spirosoma foliorum TaxID=2710596 RepID=A0A7G5H4E8_9BACT|nr:hypothetical protein [Spirosoma foliorum]QMW05990.1 hypothetical protein H3H32_14365 [Spirosoma foliorum]